MAFDMGFNFRGTSGYVTDPDYCVPVLAEAYSHTYTAANGYSINAGWTTTGSQPVDRSTSPDVRLAGINYKSGPNPGTFQVDLSSGSAPGAGDYTVDMAFGDQGFSHPYNTIDVKDDTATIVGPYSSAGTGASHYIDASGANVVPGTSSWDLVRTTASVMFASTTVLFDMLATAENACVAHFRLTWQEGALPDTSLRRLSVRGA